MLHLQALLTASGPQALEFFNEDGSAKYSDSVPEQTLESRLASMLEVKDGSFPMTVTRAPDTDEAKAFVAFIRRVLVWEQDKRPSAAELRGDRWVDQS